MTRATATAAQKARGLILAEVPRIDAAVNGCRAIIQEAAGLLASTLLLDVEKASAATRLKGRWTAAVAALRAAADALPDDLDNYNPPTDVGP